jgi:glycosyltransferase involved in cell wall biosynthesis
MLIDFCLPAKNEELVLRDNVLRLYEFLTEQDNNYSWRIVIIINGSTDNSGAIADNLAVKYSNIKVKNIISSGKGLALKEYFLESEADILAFMDADLATSLENIPNLISYLVKENYDISIGSRLMPNSVISRSLFRDLSSRLYSKFSRLALKHNFTDLQCGFKAFTKKSAKEIFPLLIDNTWFFDTECIILAKSYNYKIKEFAVNWEDNRYFKRKTRTSLSNGWYFFKKTLSFRKYLKKRLLL